MSQNGILSQNGMKGFVIQCLLTKYRAKMSASSNTGSNLYMLLSFLTPQEPCFSCSISPWNSCYWLKQTMAISASKRSSNDKDCPHRVALNNFICASMVVLKALQFLSSDSNSLLLRHILFSSFFTLSIQATATFNFFPIWKICDKTVTGILSNLQDNSIHSKIFLDHHHACSQFPLLGLTDSLLLSKES